MNDTFIMDTGVIAGTILAIGSIIATPLILTIIGEDNLSERLSISFIGLPFILLGLAILISGFIQYYKDQKEAIKREKWLDVYCLEQGWINLDEFEKIWGKE